MWLSINALYVDQAHKKQSVVQDWEIQIILNLKKDDSNLQFYYINFSSTQAQEYYSFFNNFNFLCVFFKYL